MPTESPTDGTYTIGGLASGVYRVQFVPLPGTGTPSAVVTATPRWVPTGPRSLWAIALPDLRGGRLAFLDWQAPQSNNWAAVTDYVIEQSRDGGPWSVVADGHSTRTEVLVTGLARHATYRFRVSATNAVGTGPASNTWTVSTR